MPDDTLFPLMPEDAAWMAQASPLGTILCDAAFTIADSFYFGPDNGYSQRVWQEARVSLPPPALPCRIPGKVVTLDLLGHEHELIAHYQRLIASAAAHGRTAPLQTPFPYFAVSPTLIGDGTCRARFAWSDDLGDTKPVLEALAMPYDGDGIVWDDQDQGWQIRIAVAGGMIYGVEWDAEGPPPAADAFVVDATLLADQATAALARLATIHARLVSALGHDYWRYRRTPPAPVIAPAGGGLGRVARAVRAAFGKRPSR